MTIDLLTEMPQITEEIGLPPRRRSYIDSQRHDVAESVFLVDPSGYLTALSRHDLSGRLNYRLRNHMERWYRGFTRACKSEFREQRKLR
jgi:hypothetical protein